MASPFDRDGNMAKPVAGSNKHTKNISYNKIKEKMTLKHYKSKVWNMLHKDMDPNDRHVREWTEQWINAKRLLLDMEREGSIKIEYINHKGCIKRVCTPLDNIYENSIT